MRNFVFRAKDRPHRFLLQIAVFSLCLLPLLLVLPETFPVTDAADHEGIEDAQVTNNHAVIHLPYVVVTAAAPNTSSPTPMPTASAGSVYYVDSINGNDANVGTTETAAWKTLNKATSAPLTPGSRLLLKRGSRWSGSLTVSRSGTSTSPITIASYGLGDLPIIQASDSCIVLSGSYLTLRELQIDHCSWAGVEVSGTHNRVEHNLITNNVAGIYVRSEATNNSILNNQLKDNDRMSVLTEATAGDDSGAFGVLLHGDKNEIAYNTISGSDAFSYDYGRDGAAIEVYGGRSNYIHHNLAIDNHTFTELGNSRSADTTYAYNVVRSSLSTSTFVVTRGADSRYGPVAQTHLYNNTVLLTGGASQGVVCHAGCSRAILTMRNNIIQAVAKVGYADAPFDEDHNLFYGGVIQFTTGSHSVEANPRFLDPTNGNLRLGVDSPAIDRGVELDYRLDFDQTAVPKDGNNDGQAVPDAGAFEYQP